MDELMTDKTMILPANIKAGDKLRFEPEKVTEASATAFEYTATYDRATWGLQRGTHYLLERPKPVVLPTEPGIYADKNGYPWVLHPSVPNCIQHWRLDTDFITDDQARAYAPFTRMRDERKVAAEVLAGFRSQWQMGFPIIIVLDSIAEKWATK